LRECGRGRAGTQESGRVRAQAVRNHFIARSVGAGAQLERKLQGEQLAIPSAYTQHWCAHWPPRSCDAWRTPRCAGLVAEG